MKQIREGDVLLMAVDKKPPDEANLVNRVVLAEGELTGHAHVLTAAKIMEWSENGQRYVQVQGDAAGVLYHEDHDPVPAVVVAPGETYRVVRQQEWSLAEQWRKVKD